MSEDIFDAEHIVLLDDNLQPIGQAPKIESHHAHTPLHLAFSLYIFDVQGRLLVTRRALDKKVWPGVWTNSCCGHPMPGEKIEDAIIRRSAYELGTDVTDLTVILPDYIYKAPPYNGIVEYEFCPVYAARITSEVKPNPSEVVEYDWLTWNDFIQQAVSDSDNRWSWWCKDQLVLLRNKQQLAMYHEL